MLVVDKIYELIKQDNTINTFNNNLDLFQEFYYHNMSIRFYGRKVIEIYKYLLSLNISEEHEKMPYINSKIFQDFSEYEMFFTHSVYAKDTRIDDDYIDLLYELIKEYFELKKYELQSILNKLPEQNEFVRDYTGAMMVILNKSFFKISNQNINRLINTIKNNSYLKNIIETGQLGPKLLDKDYIFQYVSRFLFNIEFLNKENIENDLVVTSIKEAKFKDKETLKRVLKDINIYFVLLIFDGNLSLLLDALEQSLEDQAEIFEIFLNIYDKIIAEEEFRIIINFIMNDKRNKKYITEEERKKVINKFTNDYPVEITEEEIEFILSQEKNALFLVNLKSDLKDSNWSEKTQILVYEVTKEIQDYELDFNSSIEVLDSLFKKNRKINILMVIESLKRLIKDYLKREDIKIHIVNNDSYNGCACAEENCINLNYNLIKKLLHTHNHDQDPESLHILETTYHESRHIQQFTLYMEEESMDDDIYAQYKEEVLRCICSQYYKKNYVGISFEKEARIIGGKMVFYLLKQYFPYMKQSIVHYEKKVIEESQKEEKTKSIFELSENLTVDEALEKILSINPSLIEKFSGLKREYNSDGIKKIKQADLRQK